SDYLLSFIVAQYVAHALQASFPCCVVNVPNDYFSMAGFEVTLYGRFWVTPEDSAVVKGLVHWCRYTTLLLSTKVQTAKLMAHANISTSPRSSQFAGWRRRGSRAKKSAPSQYRHK